MKIPCIVCGKEAEVGNFCSECWLKQNALFEIKDFELKICDCGSYFSGRKWIKFDDLEKMLKDVISKNIKSRNRIKIKKMDLKRIANRVHAKIICVGVIPPCKLPKTEKKGVIVSIKKVKCNDCKKISASHYEAVVQLRVGESLADEILNENKRYITRVERVANGYDIYIIKKGVAKRISNKLKQRGFKIITSHKLMGRKKDKKIWRNYYSVRN